MKIRNPKSRFDLRISKRDFVLDVGGGNSSHPRANVVVDEFLFDNTHRSGKLQLLKGQRLIVANGEGLPFKNEIFDYVICSHVLEHVGNPSALLNEISRVGKRGYIETPSLIGEYLVPKKSHRWAILELEEKIVLMKKEDIGLVPSLEFGDLFQKHLARNSIEFRILMRTYPNLFTVRYEWEDKVDFLINPQDPELRSFFSSSWDKEKILGMVGDKSRFGQISSFLSGFAEVAFDFVRSKKR